MMAKKDDNGGSSKPKAAERSLKGRGQKTGVRLEDALWDELRAVADERNVSVSDLVNRIEIKGKRGNLSAVIRRFISNYRRKRR